MVFVILGSQKMQFNRILQKMDELVNGGAIAEKVFAQTGYSDYVPKYFQYKNFMDREIFSNMEEKADTIITHGGTGAIIGAVKKGKKVIAVPRYAKYGEHVDDHQIQIIREFDKMDIIEACYEVEQLGEAFKRSRTKTYLPYKSNTDQIIASIESFLEQ